MNRKKTKVVACCLLSSLAISSATFYTNAATVSTGLPTAGITNVLNTAYSTHPKEADQEIKTYLASVDVTTNSAVQSDATTANATSDSSYAETSSVNSSTADSSNAAGSVATPEQTKKEKEASQFDTIAIAQVSYYVNMRSGPSEDAEILGKIYNNSAATILEVDGDWYKVKSGSVTGYIKAEYFVTGAEAQKLAKKVGTRIATVNTTTLKVRNDASGDATVQTLVPIGEELEVIEELNGWVKVKIDSDVEGYVSADYVNLSTKFVQAESIEEEKERLAKAEAEKKAAEEAAKKADEKAAKKADEKSKAKSKTAKASSASKKTSAPSSSAAGGTRQKIVSYALQFVGNPYVYGGTSLTGGTDCSGFTQSVFRDCGISIPRTSGSQASAGSEVSLSDLQPGDLLFYSNGGGINHVALYIGNGQVVHASTEKTGIKTSSYNYRTPAKAVSYLN